MPGSWRRSPSSSFPIRLSAHHSPGPAQGQAAGRKGEALPSRAHRRNGTSGLQEGQHLGLFPQGLVSGQPGGNRTCFLGRGAGASLAGPECVHRSREVKAASSLGDPPGGPWFLGNQKAAGAGRPHCRGMQPSPWGPTEAVGEPGLGWVRRPHAHEVMGQLLNQEWRLPPVLCPLHPLWERTLRP